MINQLLNIDPLKRLDVNEIEKHAWFQKGDVDWKKIIDQTEVAVYIPKIDLDYSSTNYDYDVLPKP